MPPTSLGRVRLAPLCAGLMACVLGGGAARANANADQPFWRDIESRIQYGYYTEDVAALRHLNEAVTSGAREDKLRGYYAGLLDWRLAQLAAQSTPAAGDSAASFAQRCVSEVDAALALQADFAEALALRAVCLATPLASNTAHAPFAARRARKDMERALQLASHNPRVLLLDAMTDSEVTSGKSANREQALLELREVVAAFEAERRESDQLPGWGAAEAWLLLANRLFEHGDPVASRDALEHALLIAPEYARARRLMTKITAG